jgi:hypothetical protein
VTVSRQRFGDEGAGDARADDKHIGAQIAPERACRHAAHAAALPNRKSGAKVSFDRCHA